MLYLVLSRYWYRTFIQTYSATSTLKSTLGNGQNLFAKLLFKSNNLCRSGSGRIFALPLPQEKDRFYRFRIPGFNITVRQMTEMSQQKKQGGSDIAVEIYLFGEMADIQVLINFTAPYYVAKCHVVNFSHKSHPCRLYLRWSSSSYYSRFTTLGEDRNKYRLKHWQLCGYSKLPFGHHRAIKMT